MALLRSLNGLIRPLIAPIASCSRGSDPAGKKNFCTSAHQNLVTCIESVCARFDRERSVLLRTERALRESELKRERRELLRDKRVPKQTFQRGLDSIRMCCVKFSERKTKQNTGGQKG